MKKLIIIFLIFSSLLQAKLTLNEKIQLYSEFIKSQKENIVFVTIKYLDTNKKINNIQDLASFMRNQQDMLNLAKRINNNKFNYTLAIKQMCLSIGTISGLDCPRSTFVKAILKDDKSKNLEKGSSNQIGLGAIITNSMPLSFEQADAYNNKNKYFIFDGILSQRLNRTTALFSGKKGIFLLTIPTGLRYTEGARYVGIVKGEGEYSYTNIAGAKKIVPKGVVLSITKQ